LQSFSFRTERADGENLSARRAYAKNAGASLLVEGYYRPSGDARNLALSALVFNVHTGYLIDAIFMKDGIESLRLAGVPILLEELKASGSP